MKKATRHETREFLLQALYARSLSGASFDVQAFAASYYDDRFQGVPDAPYFTQAFSGIIEKEGQLLAIVAKFAPKFDVSIMPTMNILPIFIAAYEMLYFSGDAIPEKVSIDEAIELAKKFCDDGAKGMVNGVLNALKDAKDATKTEVEASTSQIKHIF